jgi:cyanophycinase
MTKLFQIVVALLLIIAGILIYFAETSQKRNINGRLASSLYPTSRWENPGGNQAWGGPIYNLGGGGPDVADAIQWLVNQVRTKGPDKVNVVVIRAAGDDSYNSLIYRMRGVNSVETLLVRNQQDANRSEIVNKVRNAGVIFFAGGDQCQYIRNWKNTKLKAAVESVYLQGGGIGGTSAGAMIQSEYIYNACSTPNHLESRDALADPYREITFTYNFFAWKHLQGTIIDTHFQQRDRMGRLMAFIARQIQDGVARSVLGIAVSEETSIVIDRNGLAKVMGNGPVYFVLGDHPPEVCRSRTPLTFSGYKIWKVRRGDTFNLRDRPTTGYYLRSVDKGRIDSHPY